MNNGAANQTISEELIQSVVGATTQVKIHFAALALLFYASLLHLDDEVQYIWKPKFTIATFLYLFSKYPPFLILIVALSANFAQSLRQCNDRLFLAAAVEILPTIGAQGLISIRTYALCKGYRPMTIALSATFFIILALAAYGATSPACDPRPSYISAVFLTSNIILIILDLSASLAVIRQVWGLWKEQQSLQSYTKKNFASLLLHQGVLRFCFVLLIPIVFSLIQYFSPFIGSDIGTFENVLSTILICEFTLALRRRNTGRSIPNQSALELPTLSFQDNPVQSLQSVLAHLHESIMTDMGERVAPRDVDSTGQQAQDQENS